jgi:hypothetical protein
MSLTREQILAADDLPREKVATPKGDVWVRVLTAEDREAWEAAVDASGAARPRGHIRATLVALTACDEAGDLLFTTADIPALARKPIAFILPLFDAAIRLGKVSAADVDALEKNSDAGPSDSSASGSPGT